MTLLQHEITDFTVSAYNNGQLQDVSKKDLLGHWSVLFFYPADFSFVCPTELEDLADHYSEFKQAGCEVYAVSCDTQWVHKAWHDSNEKIGKVNYPMLADPPPRWRVTSTPTMSRLVWPNAATSSSTPKAMWWPTRSFLRMWGVMPTKSCAVSRPRSSSTNTAIRSARPSGSPAKRRSSRASTL